MRYPPAFLNGLTVEAGQIGPGLARLEFFMPWAGQGLYPPVGDGAGSCRSGALVIRFMMVRTGLALVGLHKDTIVIANHLLAPL
jgi:hypothetical protein